MRVNDFKICIYQEGDQWYAQQRKRLGETTVEVTTVPITIVQAMMLRIKFSAVFEKI